MDLFTRVILGLIKKSAVLKINMGNYPTAFNT